MVYRFYLPILTSLLMALASGQVERIRRAVGTRRVVSVRSKPITIEDGLEAESNEMHVFLSRTLQFSQFSAGPSGFDDDGGYGTKSKSGKGGKGGKMNGKGGKGGKGKGMSGKGGSGVPAELDDDALPPSSGKGVPKSKLGKGGSKGSKGKTKSKKSKGKAKSKKTKGIDGPKETKRKVGSADGSSKGDSELVATSPPSDLDSASDLPTDDAF